MNYQQLVQDAKTRIKEVTVEQLYQLQSNAKAIIIDIREPAEMQTGIIQNAIRLPRGVLEGSLSTIACVKDLENPLQALSEHNIYLYCRTGARSALAAESLQKMGFERVYSVAGGTVAWQQKGYPLVTSGEK